MNCLLKKAFLTFTVFISAVIFFGGIITFSTYTYGASDYQSKLKRNQTLITSNDPARYAKFTADGNVIYAEGYFKSDPVVNFYIIADNLKDMKSSFKRGENGAFSAYFSASCKGTFSYAAIELQSGQVLMYRAEYSNGWFFGDNGLAEENKDIMENHLTADEETCAYYVNADLDMDKTRRVLGEIRETALEITSGLDDDYQKAKALNYWVADNIYYDRDAYYDGVTPETISLTNVITTYRTVCGGYANIYAALLEAVGIKAVNVKGGVVAEDCAYEQLLTKTVVHEWTAFWYEKEGRWVITDPGWDSGNTYKDGKFSQKPHGTTYFDINEYAFALNHRADKAEYREYFSAIRYLQDNMPDAADDFDNAESEKPVENQILITEETTKQTEQKEPGAETTHEYDENKETEKTDRLEQEQAEQTETETETDIPLIAAITALCVGIAVTLVIIIRSKMRN